MKYVTVAGATFTTFQYSVTAVLDSTVPSPTHVTVPVVSLLSVPPVTVMSPAVYTHAPLAALAEEATVSGDPVSVTGSPLPTMHVTVPSLPMCDPTFTYTVTDAPSVTDVYVPDAVDTPVVPPVSV